VLVEDELTYAAREPRISTTVETAEDGSTTFARLVVCTISRSESFSPHYRQMYGLPDSGSVTLVGGGLCNGRAAAELEPGHESEMASLVASVTAQAEADGGTAMTPFLPAPLAPGFLTRARTVDRSVDAWHTLDLPPSGDLGDLIAGLRKQQHRATWRRDAQLAEHEDLETRAVDSEAGLEAYGPLIHEVERRHGQASSARLAIMRQQTLLRLGGRHVAIETRRGDTLLGVTMLRSYGGYTDVHTIGLAPDVPNRRDLYHICGYLGPTRWALDHHQQVLSFGRSHGTPKLARGCRRTMLDRVYY
jgi:hypothetical protein